MSTLLPFQQHRVKIYDAPIDDAYILRAEASYFPNSPVARCTSLLRLLLVDRANASRYWEIAAIPEECYTFTLLGNHPKPANDYQLKTGQR